MQISTNPSFTNDIRTERQLFYMKTIKMTYLSFFYACDLTSHPRPIFVRLHTNKILAVFTLDNHFSQNSLLVKARVSEYVQTIVAYPHEKRPVSTFLGVFHFLSCVLKTDPVASEPVVVTCSTVDDTSFRARAVNAP